ncbi:MAG: phospho-sugar mutase [Eubacterium coprostanoligenes]|uniref:phospho-sugar mutase n=1 Tax=Eubacterium coprostanoligenes TaxID=290054 RepID=UPI00240A6CA1|nr:phospho-sugar mutase [Eubacterium coprostanoligenes]MDD6665837.1 phospho-sugar mutase [Eubacterium coprostanoligenes]
MDINQKYNLWLTFDDETKKELESVTDKKEIEDRFYKDLEFGTGGLRGIMGAGTNRMNSYTVGKASLGFAKYLKDKYDGEISVVIACDSRLNSRAFEWDSARVFASQGIKVYAYTQIVPVPMLSFATRYLHCNAGVMITASHNPKEYNGYKAYDNTGCQLCTDDAKEVLSYINAIDDYSSVYNDVKTVDEYISDGMIVGVYDELFDEFIKAVKTQSLYNEHSELKIVYTPLHGTGNVPVRKVLEDKIVYVVKEQEEPNGNFPTVVSPNPEDRKALTLGIELAKEKDADIVLGTDPDCDRVGVAVKHNGEYVLLTGNQTGALLVNFVLTMKKDSLNSKSTLVKTIVTSELGANIGRSFGLQVEETLTGFKYIGDKINKFETSGEQEFVIGYEESYGYLVGTHARDKDGVVSSMLVCEMAAWYKNQGKTLVDGLNEIYDKYGYYLDFLDSFVLKGKDGAEKIQNLMIEFRNKGKELLPDIKEIVDFKDGIRDLPKENVLKYIFNDGSWMAVRPSGTEPKIKVYYSIVDPDKSKAKARLENIRQTISSIINA